MEIFFRTKSKTGFLFASQCEANEKIHSELIKKFTVNYTVNYSVPFIKTVSQEQGYSPV